jgi:hypothetical protein
MVHVPIKTSIMAMVGVVVMMNEARYAVCAKALQLMLCVCTCTCAWM